MVACNLAQTKYNKKKVGEKMAKTIVTQFGEFLNYDNLVKIGIVTNW